MAGSYWHRGANNVLRYTSDGLPQRIDFAVIGAGLSGLATALALRERCPSAVIVVFEANCVGYGASGRNAGLLSPIPAPVWLLDAGGNQEHTWASAHLNAGVHQLGNWIMNHIPEAGCRPARLTIDSASTLTDGGLEECSRLLTIAGLSHQVAKNCAQPNHIHLAMDSYMLDPYQLVRALAARAYARGIHIRERSRVCEIQPTRSGARLSINSTERIKVDQVIVCSNAYTGDIRLRERLPAIACHSFMLATNALDETARGNLRRNGDFAVELNRAETYHRLDRGRILFGGDDRIRAPPGGDFAVPRSVIRTLTSRLQRSFPNVATMAIEQAWSGKLHATTTGLPLIRRSTKISAVTYNVGYGGTGVALALLCAPLTAALCSGLEFAQIDDARLMSAIANTRPPIRSALRAAGRLLARLAHPSTPR